MPILHEELDGIKSTSSDSDGDGEDYALKLIYLIAIALMLIVAFGGLSSLSSDGNDTTTLKDEHSFGQFEGDIRENLLGEWKVVEMDGHEPGYLVHYNFFEDNSYRYEEHQLSDYKYINGGNWKLKEEENQIMLYNEDPENASYMYCSFSEDGNMMSWDGMNSEWNLILEKISNRSSF